MNAQNEQTMTKANVIKVKKKNAEKKINELKKKGLYDNNFEIIKDKKHIWIPVKRKTPQAIEKMMPFNEKMPALNEKFGIRAFDMIGEIIIIFIPDELKNKKHEIGRFLLRRYPRIKAVYMELQKAEGDLRIQPMELIAGEGSETTHYENNLPFTLDVTKVFFSPRQKTERKKLLQHIQKDDIVCVFFSGIAPIPIYLSKFTNAKKIFGIELNPIAHEYALKNIEQNNCQNVSLFLGDVKEIGPKLAEKYQIDLLIMALPKNNESFIQTAKKTLDSGGRLICYITATENKLNEKLQEFNENNFHIIKKVKGISIAPFEWRYTIHLRKKGSKR